MHDIYYGGEADKLRTVSKGGDKMRKLLIILAALTLIGGLQLAYAQGPEPPALPTPEITPLPSKDGAISGVISHVHQVTVGENGVQAAAEERGYVEEVKRRTVSAGALDQSVTWTLRSLLQYYDHANWEEVQGASDNWTDTTVYMLEVRGELYRNGDRLWNNTVTNYNTTYVSSGYSPWYVGYNAFWQSKGYHSMKVTSTSPIETGYSEASRQF